MSQQRENNYLLEANLENLKKLEEYIEQIFDRSDSGTSKTDLEN